MHNQSSSHFNYNLTFIEWRTLTRCLTLGARELTELNRNREKGAEKNSAATFVSFMAFNANEFYSSKVSQKLERNQVLQ